MEWMRRAAGSWKGHRVGSRRVGFLPLAIGLTLAVVAAVPAWAGVGSRLLAVPAPREGPRHAVPASGAVAQAGYAFVDFDASVVTQYDSSGGNVTASSLSGGAYVVTFAGLAFPNGGDVQLTSLADGACTIADWSSSLPVTVYVDCYNYAGNPEDQGFDILVTQPVRRPSGVFDYAWVYKPKGPLSGQYEYNSSHRTNSVAHLGTGQYLVTMPGPAVPRVNTGTVKVSAYGVLAGSCQLAKWTASSTAQLIYVDCFAPSGSRQDRKFTVVYARGNNLMGQTGLRDANALANGSAELYQPPVQFDSNRGAKISIAHLDRGFYQVLPIGTHTDTLIGGAGSIQTTPIGNSQMFCVPHYEFTTRVPVIFIQCSIGQVHREVPFTVQWVVR